ncbi:uncharacterized protein EKO05_0001771 [Ascochyta rabiei]|uniref:CFEM domain-containing protein n=1 Tax=Didymella rabiei TaxID=5454 RepID=A0A163BHE1_DIDRA|nr:uncharacterized protein EKO05_0001771 [Ascochyta rabiei]KZM21770.1 hypothetical protein ST47_g7167 [Ascochyta rabiei]UPX11149.1 hypothetical protein EKO05_0001771 [Ascochyta rabiei]
MKTFTVASIIALASVASAQLDNIPSCALTCFITPLTTDGCSGLTDFACHCKKGTELLATVQPCVQKACSAEDQATTISGVESTCAAAGVPIEIPDSSSAVSSAAASVTSAAASSAAASASSVISQASSAVESAASSLSSAIASGISSAQSVASSHAATATHSSNGTASATPSASQSQFTGAAAQATHAAGLLGAAALALFAL